jgi:hypothetical protein
MCVAGKASITDLDPAAKGAGKEFFSVNTNNSEGTKYLKT